MEVHTHTHTERKRLQHYLFEFFMLFLAVFCGFLAENQREHIVEHQREKQYMASLSEDLNEDIQTLGHQITTESYRLTQIDSLLHFLNNKTDPAPLRRIYYIGRIASRHDIFNYNNRTIDQMRNSGAFRLVRKKEIANQVMDYYRQIKLLEMLEAIEKDEENEYRTSAVKIFDPEIFNSMVDSEDEIIPPVGDPALRTQSPDLLADFSGWTQYMKSSVVGLTKYKKDLKKSAEQLVSSIKKEYHLK